MRYYFLVLIFFQIILACVSSAQLSNPPKRELRGAWIATVTNIDWPSQPGLPVAQQQSQLISILDQLKSMGINAVFFQIRSECDAMYESNIEPWSYWLTGKQGLAPSPLYDPLQFAIQEAHMRGMELHAWFNPYRALRDTTQAYDTPDPSHVTVKHPDWILIAGTTKYLNPGFQQVRDYITSVFMDVVRRYDVDGVHIDDYFYPYSPEITYQDTATFRLYNRGFTDIGAWRRDNVNLLIKEIHDSVNAVKPQIKWGVSPFGIWKSGVPTGITGLDQYSEIYADPIAWLEQKTVDYIAPQLYWPNGGGQDYAKLVPWWSDSTSSNGRQLLIGQAAYQIPNWSSGEMERQIRQNRANGSVSGSIFFSTNSLTGNFGGFADSLEQSYYRYPALVPQMNWKDITPPNPPSNLRYEQIAALPAELQWDIPTPTSSGDSASRYVLYKFSRSNPFASDFDSASNIILVTGENSANSSIPQSSGPTFYAVSSVDENNNESTPSSVLRIDAPPAPLLVSPANGSNARDTTLLVWESPGLVSSYTVQVSSDPTFSNSLGVKVSVQSDTTFAVTGLNGLQKYYWHVGAANAGGVGPYSTAQNFTTAFPLVPVLSNPAGGATNVSLTPTFTWNRADSAIRYRFQLSKGVSFAPTLIDTTITDTIFTDADSLIPVTIYAWRVSAGNNYGFSNFSNYNNFRTTNITFVLASAGIPTQFVLYQNYPNPFNPTTTIRFAIPTYERVSLTVYDVLGRTVGTLVNQQLPPGSYKAIFDGSLLPSGVYICRLSAGQQINYIKLLLLK